VSALIVQALASPFGGPFVEAAVQDCDVIEGNRPQHPTEARGPLCAWVAGSGLKQRRLTWRGAGLGRRISSHPEPRSASSLAELAALLDRTGIDRHLANIPAAAKGNPASRRWPCSRLVCWQPGMTCPMSALPRHWTTMPSSAASFTAASPEVNATSPGA
jgi:hypothetical protein